MQIKYSETAFRDLEAIENFLLYKWNETVLMNFGVALENCIRTIIEGVVVFRNMKILHIIKYLLQDTTRLFTGLKTTHFISSASSKTFKILTIITNP